METPELKKMSKAQDSLAKKQSLFAKCFFLLNRETPIYALQYLVLSFGGTFVTQDDEDNKNITHHVLDRPMAGIKREIKREYVQP